ncbi:MAG: serine/threonine-protein kinase [Myxococcota bacterium]
MSIERPLPPDVPQIPGFKLKSILGQGGVGRVYRAQDSTGRDVALKVMPLEVDETREKRFAQEASIGRMLDHPGIIKVFDAGTHSGQGWISMEVLSGTELAQVMRYRRPTLGLAERLQIIAQVADALHYAHQHGVVHRDVKPSNIFLATGGGVKLLDFGIARFKATKITKTGFIVGTPQYMSPEHVTGVTIDARADVFSLAVVAYELLTGQLPWNAEGHHQIMMAICIKPPIPFEQAFEAESLGLTPEDCQNLHNIIHRGLRQEPGHRYPDAAAFAMALRDYTQGSNISAAGITHVDAELEQQRRMYWAFQRAALLKIEKSEPVANMTEPVTHVEDDETAGGSNLLWLSLLALFSIGLGIALWLMLFTQ